MKNYKRINTSLGWLVFIIASIVYILTSEPTASFWDPGEYIATTFKMQVGHPPGAPFFQLLGRFFTLFAFGDVKLVARMVNTMSALASGATIMFLFWTITALARKIGKKEGEEHSAGRMWAILGSGLVGALAYTFSDSFWFSAVEGEVYATSSLFTAVVFWAILKWEAVADDDQSWRWIILIAFLMGLSIGVHLLNLLAIPAITFVYYFRKFKTSRVGFLITLLVSVLLLAAVMYGIIPQVVYLFATTELVFVNSLGLPFNSGTIFVALLVIALVVMGLRYTYKPNRINGTVSVILSGILVLLILAASTTVGEFIVRLLICAGLVVLGWFGRRHYAILKTTILCFAFIIIGYSTFLTLVIRSNAGTPINENSPKDAISLLSYLMREQYGTWPLLYGQYYNAPVDPKQPYLDGNPIYGRDDKAGKYVVIDDRKATIPNYDDRFCTIFPRMWSNNQDIHVRGYKSWANIAGTPITVAGYNGKPETLYRPTFAENIRFFFSYQLGFMYFRYFMWNFAGKQNDIQGYGGSQNGNWISGIKFIDEWRLGPQSNLPGYMAKNKGRNVFYLLPLLLGLVGFLYHLNTHSRGTWIVSLLFIFTGIAINVYLNIVPYQPRERDYAYAASFYAFAMWIGIGVLPLFVLIRKWLKDKLAAILSTVICLLLVPTIMAKEGWDDHDRSNRYTVVDIAGDYLNSCAPNAILFTLGDNDTFPLWYAQEVEGIRTDVRVANLSLLNADWYIDQMKKKAYDSDPLPLTIPHEKYSGSKREVTYMYEDTTLVPRYAFVNLKKVIEFATSDDPRAKLQTRRGDVNYFPTSNFTLPVDSAFVIKSGLVPRQYADSVFSLINWTYPDYAVQKNTLMVLDLLANFEWKRPVYFAITTGDDAYMGLQNYFRVEGLAYRLVPYYCNSIDRMVGQVSTDIMYNNMMNKFKWGNMNNPEVYLDEQNMHLTGNLRNSFSRLAFALAYENKMDLAVKVCDRCVEVMPNENVPYDKMMIPIADVYCKAGKMDKAVHIINILLDRSEQELLYYSQFSGADGVYLENDKKESRGVVQTLGSLAEKYKMDNLYKRSIMICNKYPQ